MDDLQRTKYLKQQYQILLDQSKLLGFTVEPINTNGSLLFFNITNVTENDITKLNILSPKYNFFIYVNNIRVFSDSKEYTNITLNTFLNEAITTTNTKKTIMQPFSKLYGTEQHNVNELTDDLTSLVSQSTKNNVKTYNISLVVVKLLPCNLSPNKDNLGNNKNLGDNKNLGVHYKTGITPHHFASIVNGMGCACAYRITDTVNSKDTNQRVCWIIFGSNSLSNGEYDWKAHYHYTNPPSGFYPNQQVTATCHKKNYSSWSNGKYGCGFSVSNNCPRGKECIVA